MADSSRGEELAAAIREIQDRVRARYPQGSAAGSIPIPDLMPLLHARDAAAAKVAAIGTVNPRAGGPLNSLVQSMKRLVARALDWHVREQVEYNRASLNATQAVLDALNETNRSIAALAGRVEAVAAESRAALEAFDRTVISPLGGEVRELKDIRVHWTEWRKEWERKLSVNEVQFLRSAAGLQAGFTHRTGLMEANFREIASSQHQAFEGALARHGAVIQEKLWADLERIRREYERLIHGELRTVRQRMAAAPATASSAPEPPAYDALHFAAKFRGPEEYVVKGLNLYTPVFAGRRDILDIGCGRGEFLSAMAAAGVEARGIDLSAESVAICRGKGLQASEADVFAELERLPAASLGGVFCSQVVEHLAPERLPVLIKALAERMERGAPLAIETPNPECLAIFSTHFYLDPTHTRPVPPKLLAFYLEEYGFGRIQIHRLSPAVESMPELASLPADFRDAFFGALDYAAIAVRL